jgi:P4 family phage/plasmid primase-like protien
VTDKIGVDDFLVAEGTVPALEAMAVSFEQWLQATAEEDENDIGLTKELADAICTETSFAQDAGGKLYRFTGGVYRSDAAGYVKRQVKTLLVAWERTEEWSSHRSDEVVEYLRADAPELWERPPLDVVNVQNGLLNVHTRELTDHDPRYLSPVQLPIMYEPAALCPAWDQFVSEVFPDDATDLAFEIPAHLMRPDTSIQKAILFLGSGGNGKSTYLGAVCAFLGRANFAALSLHRLESDRFATARLVGKLANISADLPSEHLASTDVFKMITGGDPLPAEYKYKDSFDFTPYARLVFSANHPPRSSDGSQAFFDRWLVVPFLRSFRGTAEEILRDEMDARLSAPRELSGVLNRALDALAGIRKRGGLTESASMRAAFAEFRQTTDPLSVWLDRATIEDSGALVTKGALLAAYNQEAAREGLPRMTATGFGLAIRKLRPALVDTQRTVSGKVQWVWLGIGLLGRDPEGGPSRPSRGSLGSITVTSAGSEDENGSAEKTLGDATELTIVEPREPSEDREAASSVMPPGDGSTTWARF